MRWPRSSERRADPGEEKRLDSDAQGSARAYQDAAPALFLVEQVDLYAHAPRTANVRLRNRVPIYEAIVPATPRVDCQPK